MFPDELTNTALGNAVTDASQAGNLMTVSNSANYMEDGLQVRWDDALAPDERLTSLEISTQPNGILNPADVKIMTTLKGKVNGDDEKTLGSIYIDAATDVSGFQIKTDFSEPGTIKDCLLYTAPSPRDATLSRMPSSA